MEGYGIDSDLDIDYYLRKIKRVIKEIEKTVIGKEDVICKVMMAILVDGHVLLEDIPGVGKTTMAEAFAASLGLQYTRVQFTPDVMPSDITGFNMYNKENNRFEYRQGAAFCNLLLADEINRTSPKTQSALLQIMEEKCVSVDGETYALPAPFIVIATQNPYGSVGTQRLPESQLDRFMVCMSIGYPSIEDEISILKEKQKHGAKRIMSEQVIKPDDFLEIKEAVRAIHVDDSIYEYAARMSKATRQNPHIQQGVSPRGTIALIAMSKAEAFLRGNAYVRPSDVRNVAMDVLSHRIVMNEEFRRGMISKRTVIENIIADISVPDIYKKGSFV